MAGACTEQYGRAYRSNVLPELCEVIKDNFCWCCSTNVINADFIVQYREDFARNKIYANISVESGYLLCDNATVEACGNATVEACDNATVEACGNATVEACDNATVRAYGNATVEACGNATVEACDNATVRACGNATVRAYGNATVEACDNATVEACDNATVEAYGNAYCSSTCMIECRLSGNALYRVRSTNAVYFASDSINFGKWK